MLRHSRYYHQSKKICSTQNEFQESNLEREFCFALRLSPDDEREDETHHEDEAESNNVPQSSAALNCQNAKGQDQRSCRRTSGFTLFHVCMCRLSC